MSTRAAWIGRSKEVVEVGFDPKVVSYEELVRRVFGKAGEGWSVLPCDDEQQSVAERVFEKELEPHRAELRDDKDPKYYLSRTELKHLPMTEAQAVWINARLEAEERDEALSPRQRALLAEVRAHPKAKWPNLIGAGLEGWSRIESVRSKLSSER